VGAPPGYVGYEEGGQLTERIRRRPYAVVLLDEIEKAHPDIFNLLLQILEDGRLTDSFGRKVDFRNTILIMTSNLGADLMKKQGAIGFKAQEDAADFGHLKDKLLDEVKRHFKPEFLNRVDEIAFFEPLTREHLTKIVELELNYLIKRLAEQDIHVELDQDAKELLIDKGFDPIYGARPLRRIIQRYVEDPLAQDIIAHRFEKNAHVRVTRKGDELEFTPES
jgi:ATP-dependent Clp protease ATP-binding subunit ClpC